MEDPGFQKKRGGGGAYETFLGVEFYQKKGLNLGPNGGAPLKRFAW